jgi:hypothetical protein
MRRLTMAVLLRFSVPGLTPEVFERIAGGLREAELLREQPGFLMQAVYATDDGLGAVEIWDTVEQWREWDDKYRPKVDVELESEHLGMTAEVVELHKFVLR